MPGFTITGPLSSDPTGTEWGAVRNLDGRRCVLTIIPVGDVAAALESAVQQIVAYDRVGSEHLVRRDSAIAVGDGALALVFDESVGGTLAQLLGTRGQLSPGETVTIVAPLLASLADMHAVGIVHGDLTPAHVLVTEDGRPLIGNLGVANLLGSGASVPGQTRDSGFVAPELVGEAGPSPAADVYAMAALAWFCLTGAPPGPARTRSPLSTLRSQTPPGLVEVLTACLVPKPAQRPCAGAAAVAIFDAAPAESVALAPICDPAAEITRRIRAAAVAVSEPAPPGFRKKYQAPLVLGVVSLLVAVALGAGVTWFVRRPPVALTSPAVGSATQPLPARTIEQATPVLAQPSQTPVTMPATMRTAVPRAVVPTTTLRSPVNVVTAPTSPRVAAARLLQALVDARALAYVARNAALLDLAYAPGAPKAAVDKANIATALTNGGTYLGLSFVVKDVAFLDGTSGTARVRATILTPAYRTGQPDGRTISHAEESLGPCVFSLSLTSDRWRILALTVS